jgi:hypothetical protein
MNKTTPSLTSAIIPNVRQIKTITKDRHDAFAYLIAGLITGQQANRARPHGSL